ncbi:protoporphyrinogen/coproporphyrinogen oxidase [Microbacterium hatanonis]|uniref:NAD(P)-binding protein n=1 Tax=Microbacterium hatanonis TaxID=404366 RepID=A0A5C8HXA4_9MICO|nr:FAD-dependent oxidoreductase [Microbacterium hatanonis]TXK09882.1 NAD(P)-binding protein [Microbacterium hatanonis]
MTEPLDRLAAHAAESHAVVVGGGMAGLAAALEFAKVGLRVTVLEAGDRLGGVLRSAEVGGFTLDVGAESYATRGGTVRALVDELGLGDAVTTPNPAGAWVAGLPGGLAAPLPRGGVLGIPANPWSPEVRRIIGRRGVWRAFVDRIRPPLTIGHERSLGTLVRSRMGERVLDRLVAPVTGGVYSARPDDIDVDIAAPGLNAALTRTGSLSGAVADLTAGRTAAPGSAVEGIVGGMGRLVDALVSRLADLDVELRTGADVAELRRGAAEPGDGAEGWSVVLSDGTVLAAGAVLVALPEAAARRVLAPHVPDLDPEAGESPVVEVVTLVVDAPDLDRHPRGSGVLVVPGARAAKALTHSTAKWSWLAEQADPGVHVVRVSFGAQGEEPATAGLDDTDAARLALAEASALLGVPLQPAHLRAARRERYTQSQPGAFIGRAERTGEARDAIRAVAGIGAAGAWLSGTGLAQVVPDAQHEADRLRSALLWSGGTPL